MTAIRDNLPALVVVAPLCIGFVLPTIVRRLRLVESLVIAITAIGLLGAVYLTSLIYPGGGTSIIYSVGGWPAPWGIELVAGSLGALVLLMVAIVVLPVALFSAGNLSHEVGGSNRAVWFYTLYLLLTGALAGMAVTNDLFNIFVLVEVATLSCCGMIAARNHSRAAEAALTYLILLSLGSALVLGGIGFVYIITGHLNMGYASQELSRVWQDYPRVVWLAISFLLVGFGVKSALFPLHVWLPGVHSYAPSPANAVLSGIAVKGYLICLMKILYNVFGGSLIQELAIDRIITVLAMLGIVAGSLFALTQDELKRRLAFSTVAQLGYVFLGMGLVNAKALTGSLFYILSHAVSKASLFLAAGAMITATGKERISELAGIGKKMPVTMAVFTIGSLSLVGIPLFAGFIGKWHLLLGSLEAGNWLGAAVIVSGSVLCGAYLFPVIRTAYFAPAATADGQDPGVPQKLAMILLAVAVIILGVVPGPFLELARRAAVELIATR
ncbi:MAG: monovalent cation/H+ antiporter subunit D family protein [Firmicutes bacterium]|nr:monovalent cation/H+ antiporter subunit D family protein [Bacillota bacterium]